MEPTGVYMFIKWVYIVVLVIQVRCIIIVVVGVIINVIVIIMHHYYCCTLCTQRNNSIRLRYTLAVAYRFVRICCTLIKDSVDLSAYNII